MNLTVWKKMVSGYIIIVFIPTVFFSTIYINQETKNIGDKYCSDEQKLLEQSYSNLKEQISQISVVYQLFQYSQPVTNYISGRYSTKGDEIYAYLKDIRPLFSYIHSGIRDINNITVYSYRKPLVPLVSDIIYFDTKLHSLNKELLPTYKGRWKLQNDTKVPLFTYEKALYTSSFSKNIGYLSITIDASNMLDTFSVNDNNLLLFNVEDKWLFLQGKTVRTIRDTTNLPTPLYDYFHNKNDALFINTVTINELQGKIISITPKSSVLKTKNKIFTILTLFISLLFLSFIYYMIISSVIRRLITFSSHLQKIDYNYLQEYNKEGYNDEIGLLIHSYNNMIIRIRDLVNSLNIVTLKKKEADFHALQAQIKPHFIYNSLETVRMMAEANGTPDVADILYNLGRFLRYNISTNKDITQLKSEIENVKNYLEVYKASMGRRLEFYIKIDCNIDDVTCPGFILQPIAENCIHHGIMGIRDTLVVNVHVYDQDQNIIITISDNGSGISPERLLEIHNILMGIETDVQLNSKNNSIGIVNVNERIKSFFGNQASFTIGNTEPNGTICTINFSKYGRPSDELFVSR